MFDVAPGASGAAEDLHGALLRLGALLCLLGEHDQLFLERLLHLRVVRGRHRLLEKGLNVTIPTFAISNG
eukprot:2314103-Pyramimonas_sp.AAC.1